MVRAMRRNPRALHHILRLRWFLAAFVFSIAVASVYAAGSVRVAPQSTGYVRMGQNAHGGTVWGTKTEWAAWFERQTSGVGGSAAAGAVEYATTTGSLSSSTVGGLAKKALRGGVYGAAVGLAVNGIIDGAGWAIKELQDQVYDPGTQEQLQGEGWCADDWPTQCAPTPSGLIPFGKSLGGDRGGRWFYEEARPNAGYIMQRSLDGVWLYTYFGVSLIQRPSTGWDGYTNWADGTGPSPITDDRLGDEIKKHPEVVDLLLTDPRTGKPVMTPELQQQMEDLKRKIEQREGLPTDTPGPVVDLEDDTASDEGSPWPSFCGWAKVVCDFIEWVKTDDPETDKPEVPWEEETPERIEQKWSSGLGGGSCPSPVSFTVSMGGVSASPEFDFDGICQFASMMRPVIIALAAILAGFIIGGFRGTKDA